MIRDVEQAGEGENVEAPLVVALDEGADQQAREHDDVDYTAVMAR
jgi:hypothetical protein